MAKRALDFAGSIIGLVLFSPLILIALLLVWWQDGKNPVYTSKRVGKGGQLFPFYKVRTMVVGADKTGRHTVGSDDPNVTRLGRLLRNSKGDELLQFISVLRGDMSLVGPRPNIPAASTEVFTAREMEMFAVKPGITDFASIVFSDLDKIMIGASDVNVAYTRQIRPWKSRLCLFYAQHRTMAMDIQLIWLTALNFVARAPALEKTAALLRRYGAEPDLVEVARRTSPPPEADPPH